MEATKRTPLFIVTGASCVGKSTLCEVLFKNEKEYIVMESDILWSEHYNTPEDDYREYRELWLRLCKNISQIGLPVVLCGCAIPQQFECCIERQGFTNIYYLAAVCDDDTLVNRMRNGRGINDDNWIKSSRDLHMWLKNNATKTSPEIKLLDTTNLTPIEAAFIADQWIMECIKKDRMQN